MNLLDKLSTKPSKVPLRDITQLTYKELETIGSQLQINTREYTGKRLTKTSTIANITQITGCSSPFKSQNGTVLVNIPKIGKIFYFTTPHPYISVKKFETLIYQRISMEQYIIKITENTSLHLKYFTSENLWRCEICSGSYSKIIKSSDKDIETYNTYRQLCKLIEEMHIYYMAKCLYSKYNIPKEVAHYTSQLIL